VNPLIYIKIALNAMKKRRKGDRKVIGDRRQNPESRIQKKIAAE
jgi:hypothetical protein